MCNDIPTNIKTKSKHTFKRKNLHKKWTMTYSPNIKDTMDEKGVVSLILSITGGCGSAKM